MKWNDHSKIAGSHAFLSPSKSTWLRKTDDELLDAKRNSYAQAIGTLMHAYAADCIRFRERMKKTDQKGVKIDLMRNGVPEFAIDMDTMWPTFMTYVNDAIGFRLDPEVPLYYSDECFGTADAINLDGKVLRIHDLKTGRTEAKMDQLMVYAALFYLEYSYKPEKVPAVLRIYQMGEVLEYKPEPDDVRDIMDGIVQKNAVLQTLRHC